MKGMGILFLIMALSLGIAFMWNSIPIIKSSVHYILDPSAGWLLDLNFYLGIILLCAFLTFVTTIIQKYATDQETIRKIKAEQKQIQEEIKKLKNQPEKMLELNRKQMEKMPEMMQHTMRPLLYTFIPFVLLFRWFGDYFTGSALNSTFLIFPKWVWIYLVLSIIFNSFFRKILKVA
ncbi:DUF106 domain-containing protein [Candidatus Pacearchaeota archaeon]|nr:DUF106 domain-containing protein [Candidatus Pacearchaeota archaeon]